MSLNWTSPKTPRYDKGTLVVQSDDGMAKERAWVKLFDEINRDNNTWSDYNITYCLAIITGQIDSTKDFLNSSEVKKYSDANYEILSHGKHHVGLGSFPLSSIATAGESVISVTAAQAIYGRFNTPYLFEIYEGSKQEEIRVVNNSSTTITIETPLKNSYTTAAKVRLTDSSADLLLNGAINDAKSWGVEIKHHVFTYHYGSHWYPNDKIETWINKYFDSARGVTTVDGLNYGDNFKLYNMNCLLLTGASPATMTTIDNLLTKTINSDGVLIVYGHAEGDTSSMDALKYIVNQALNRGVRIATQSQAVEILKNKQSQQAMKMNK